MSDSYDVLNESFKGESQLNTSEGYSTQVFILGWLPGDQIYLFERWGQRRRWQRMEGQSDTADPTLWNNNELIFMICTRLSWEWNKKKRQNCGINCCRETNSFKSEDWSVNGKVNREALMGTRAMQVELMRLAFAFFRDISECKSLDSDTAEWLAVQSKSSHKQFKELLTCGAELPVDALLLLTSMSCRNQRRVQQWMLPPGSGEQVHKHASMYAHMHMAPCVSSHSNIQWMPGMLMFVHTYTCTSPPVTGTINLVTWSTSR